MNILVILGRARDVSEIAASAVLAAFGLAGCAAGVHQEERSFRVLRNGLDNPVAIFLQGFIDEKIATNDHGCFRRIFSGIALPYQDLFDLLALFRRGLHGNIRAGLVIHPLPIAAVAVRVNEDAAAGIGGAQSASFAAESAEDDRVHDAEPRASQHGNR